MHTLYNLVSGPLVWLSFILFIGGVIYRLITMGIEAKQKDSVFYEYWSMKYAFRSIFHWIIPFRATNMKNNPTMTIVTFVFHICLILTPIFLSAHIMLWAESWGISWWFIPNILADLATLLVIASCIYFLMRRLKRPEVKYLTTTSDYVLLAIVALPFITGFWAYHHIPGYRIMTILHMLSGEVMLVAIPFTRLSHMIFFPFTRGYMGSEFGAVRHAQDW